MAGSGFCRVVWRLVRLHGKDGVNRKHCLSDGQERTVLAFSEPQITNFSVENGMNHDPGYNVLRGSDLVGNMGWVSHPFHPALPFFNSFYYLIGDGIVRSFLAAGPQVLLGAAPVNAYFMLLPKAAVPPWAVRSS